MRSNVKRQIRSRRGNHNRVDFSAVCKVQYRSQAAMSEVFARPYVHGDAAPRNLDCM